MNKQLCVVLVLAFGIIATALYITYNIYDIRKIYKYDKTSADIGVCPNPFLSVVRGGNTANQIWEYLSVFVISKLYPEKHFMAYIPDGIINEIQTIFKPVTLKKLSTFKNQCNNSANHELKIDEDFDSNKLPPEGKGIILEKYSARYEDILRYGMMNIKKELRYKDEKVTEAMNKLNDIRKQFNISKNVEPTFIGVHYRGGDYLRLLRNYGPSFKGPSNYTYYEKAMDYFKARFLFPIFILISSDRKWVEENAPKLSGNIVVLPYKASDDKSKDFYLLSHCNNTILNYGTFSSIAALLNGGITLVYDLEVKLDYMGQTVAMGIATLLDNWMAIKAQIEHYKQLWFKPIKIVIFFSSWILEGHVVYWKFESSGRIL